MSVTISLVYARSPYVHAPRRFEHVEHHVVER